MVVVVAAAADDDNVADDESNDDDDSFHYTQIYNRSTMIDNSISSCISTVVGAVDVPVSHLIAMVFGDDPPPPLINSNHRCKNDSSTI